jgi:hypothetical protein
MDKSISTTFKYKSKQVNNKIIGSSLFKSFRFTINVRGLKVGLIEESHSFIRVKLHSNTSKAQCPYCHQYSKHKHSHYTRHLQDIPVYDRTLLLEVQVGKYRCGNPGCERKIFAERLRIFVILMPVIPFLQRNRSYGFRLTPPPCEPLRCLGFCTSPPVLRAA